MPTKKQTAYAEDLAADLEEDLDEIVRSQTDYDCWDDCDIETASEIIDYMLDELRARRAMEREFWD